PFAAMLAGGVLAWIEKQPKAAKLVAGLALAGLLVFSAANMFAATAVKPEIDTKYKRPYQQFVWKNFYNGRLSVSRQTIDMKPEPPAGPRQAWNLGMKLGLDGLPSLVPLALWMLACAAWLARALRLLPVARAVRSSREALYPA